MKFSLFVLSALAAIAYAAPSAQPAADSVEQPAVEKRQVFGCGSCVKHKKLCWSCNSGGCSYMDRSAPRGDAI
ncbi:uncharacterized protein DNG_09019 [Cephalotrichum gorgonifer]|uniref:Uncharacterized protein n=1 Tax=Cephalotrichum gorgonifer TaxID=2041049 RepID=A0AAE8SYX2_9PEZI|nr:uncharacterized protein DNG_09019 [Cephalotrichum gorgonifer]